MAPISQVAKKLSGTISYVSNCFSVQDKVQAVIKEFMNANPGTKIELEALAEVDKVLQTGMAAGEVADLTVVPSTMLPANFLRYYAPLDDLGYTKDNLYFYSTGLGTDGHLYEISSIVGFAGMVYNKKVFADAGITSVPKTLDNFYADCKNGWKTLMKI